MGNRQAVHSFNNYDSCRLADAVAQSDFKQTSEQFGVWLKDTWLLMACAACHREQTCDLSLYSDFQTTNNLLKCCRLSKCKSNSNKNEILLKEHQLLQFAKEDMIHHSTTPLVTAQLWPINAEEIIRKQLGERQTAVSLDFIFQA